MTCAAVGLALLAAGFALAQNQPLDLSQQGAQEQTDRGFDDRQEQSELGQTKDGPSILSRETGWTNQRGGKLIGFQFFGEIAGVYDSGLTPVSSGVQPSVGNAARGMEAGLGLIGSHQRRHEKFSVEYKGKYRDYANNSLFNGSDQFLSATYLRLLEHHVTLDLKQILGTTTLANGEFAYLPVTGANMFAVPANELFDNRTNYLQSSLELVWDTTERLSLGFGGQGFLVHRQSLELASLNGFGARSDIAYRLTRHQTLSASYEYASYDFERVFADAQMQIAALGYSVEFNRNWDFAMQAGTIRVETRGVTEVALDPAIAALIGESTAVVAFSRTLYLPIAEARMIRRWSRSQLTLTYSKSVTPGNGIYLTSRQSAGGLSYSYSGYRRVAMLLNFGYGELSPLGQTLGDYTNWQGGTRMTYAVARGTFLELQYDYRHYTTGGSGFRKDASRVSLGLAFNPGEAALPPW